MYFSLKCTASLCLLFGFQYVWPYTVNFEAYWIFLILLWDKTNCAIFIYSVKFSSYNVKTYNLYVNFCKNELRFMPLIIFHLNCILLLMMKMNIKQFSLQSWKIRVEGRNPLKSMWLLNVTSFNHRIKVSDRPKDLVWMSRMKKGPCFEPNWPTS